LGDLQRAESFRGRMGTAEEAQGFVVEALK